MFKKKCYILVCFLLSFFCTSCAMADGLVTPDFYKNVIEPRITTTDSECAEMNEKILSALNEENEESFMELFCEEAQNKDDFEEEIRDAMLFFEGEITVYPKDDGLIGGTEDVDDGEISRMYIVVDVKDIKTDVGKTYHIQYYCDAINKKNKEREGILELTIGDGKAICRVGEYHY